MNLPAIIYARIDKDDEGEFCVSSDTKFDMLDFEFGVYELVGVSNNKINTTGEV